MIKASRGNIQSGSKDHRNSDEMLAKYMQDNEPKGSRLSKLDPVKTFILKLNSDGYSHDQIAEFILIIGINAHSTTIGRYIRKCRFKKESYQNHDEIKPGISEINTKSEQPKPALSQNHANLDTLSRPQEKSASFTPYKGTPGDKK